MSGGKLASSFGVGQPPTPRGTPTSTVFPSPVFETPENHQGPFESTGGWTPRFVEDYYAAPGNLRPNPRTNPGAFVDFQPPATPATTTPYRRDLSPEQHQQHQQTTRKRRRDAGDFAVQIASHVNHFSPNINLPLPPVEPSRRLASSPAPPFISNERHSDPERHFKRPRIQTATPPPTDKRGNQNKETKTRSGTADNMQNDETFTQADFLGTPSQSGMTSFDLFGYPLPGPNAAPPHFENGRNFWETDAIGMGTMDMDFSVSADLFQTTSPTHRQMGSFDWGQQHTTEMFQQPSGAAGTAAGPSAAAAPPPLPHPQPVGTRPTAPAAATVRPLAPKPPVVTSSDAVSFPAGSYPSHAQNETSVGLPLFSRPPSSGMDGVPFNPMAQISATQSSMSRTEQPRIAPHQLVPRGGVLRRSVSTREMGTTKQNVRPPLSSPVKSSLQRSFSENKGKRPMHRASLPTLAPAIKPVAAQAGPAHNSNPGPQSNRPKANPTRPSGRISPSKHQHRRLPSLSAIPESSPGRSRTDVKFVIDSRGRARVEPVIVNGEHVDYPRHNQQRPSRPEWESSGDDSSDTDDEPIIIPSRTTSFALPDPLEVQPSASFHASQRSISERSAMSFASFNSERRGSRNDWDSDAETVMTEHRSKLSGDAASELKRVMENRQKMATHVANGNSRPARPMSASFGGSLISPTSMTDSSNTPTPSAEIHTAVRCVCNNTTERDNEYMVQCESCEMWLHGKCLKINRHNHPRVYICAFCANTPNMRNGRIRVAPSGHMGPPAPIPSPLAHKSFKSFR